MNDHNLQLKIYELICASPRNRFAVADLAQRIRALLPEGPTTKHYIAIDDEAATKRIKSLEDVVEILTREKQAIVDDWDSNVCVLRETLKSTEAREVILQDKVRDLKNANRTAGGENMEKLQGQLQFIVNQRDTLVKQRNNLILQRNKADLKQREYKDELVTTYSSIKVLKESLLKLRKATTDLITSEGEEQLFKLLNNSSAKVKRSGRIMNNETARIVSKQIIEDLKEAGANGFFTLVKLRDENRALKSLAMDQSQTIVELEKAKGFQYGGECQHNFGKFDKVISSQPVESVKSFMMNGEEVTPDSKDERIEKLEAHNDNLKAKVRRVVEESSNLEEALLKVARGH